MSEQQRPAATPTTSSVADICFSFELLFTLQLMEAGNVFCTACGKKNAVDAVGPTIDAVGQSIDR